MSGLLATVAVENTVLHFDREYSYRVPDEMHVLPGCRVVVPFGRSNARRQGIVLGIEQADTDDLKSILSLLDTSPILSAEMLEMVRFMKSHCFCTYYDAVKAMLPAGVNYSFSQEYAVADGLGDRVFDLPDEERRIISYILSKNNKAEKHHLLTDFGYADSSVPDRMVDSGILCRSDVSLRKLSDKTVKMVRLTADYDASLDDVRLTDKQSSVLDTLVSVGSASVKELCYYTGVTASVPDSLVKKGIAEYYDDEVFRIPPALSAGRLDIVLNDEQQAAFDSLYQLYRSDRAEVSLLYGVTGSGKTGVFFKLIERVLQHGQDVIVMVPEIALTPQLIAVFKSSFGDQVAVFHSALSLGERMDEYKRVERGIARIAVGTRSAVFAPFRSLGLIVMDEEQEHTYKSESKPRFHARELAKFRCSYHQCLLLLSSATPSVESFYMAQSGRYHLQRLTRRYGRATLPDVIIADMNEEHPAMGASAFSSELLDGIAENLEHSHQSILLLNRRGHNTFVTCSSCREPITCPNCSISLTYHSANNRLMCHYCGYSMDYTSECPTCHSHALRFSGAGTQRAEAELSDLFPSARVLRMDADSTMTRSSHSDKLSAFAAGEYDILVGTQMVAKGLDFPNVTLVGVLNADSMLYLDDFRSYENTFSLLTQVVGRSGRGGEKGRAVIQTYTPENPIISLAASQDYDAFYRAEIALRRSLLYPPYVSMCLVGFVAREGNMASRASRGFAEELTALLSDRYPDMPIRILGPSPAGVFKVNNKYRYKLVLKCRNDSRFRTMLLSLLERFGSNKEYRGVTVYADMHPIDI